MIFRSFFKNCFNKFNFEVYYLFLSHSDLIAKVLGINSEKILKGLFIFILVDIIIFSFLNFIQIKCLVSIYSYIIENLESKFFMLELS